MRLEVAVIDRKGDAQVVNAARPATLVAFEDAHEGKTMPETIREVAFVVHHALGISQPLDEWLGTLEDVSAQPETVALARRIMGGDERARKIALGELPPDEEEGEDDPSRPPPEDPAIEQIDRAGDVPGPIVEVAAGGRS
jgi:hypothetical protein